MSGDHRIEGTIVAVGPNVKPFEQTPALIDMAPTIVAALDAPTAVKPTGRVLTDLGRRPAAYALGELADVATCGKRPVAGAHHNHGANILVGL